MDTSDFVELAYRNAYQPANIRFLRNRWGAYHGLPTTICTMVVGDSADGNARNIPTPQIPEYTVDRDDGEILHRGWKDLIVMMIRDRTLRPSRELEKILGKDLFDRARKGLGCT